MHASRESPEILASNMNQFNIGGIIFIIVKIINKVRSALKLLVLIFLLTKSKCLIPVPNLIKYSPINPNIKGREILKKLGKKNVMLNFKNEFIKTSTKLKRIKESLLSI